MSAELCTRCATPIAPHETTVETVDGWRHDICPGSVREVGAPSADKLNYDGGGRVSVPVSSIVNSPKVQRQVDAVRVMTNQPVPLSEWQQMEATVTRMQGEIEGLKGELRNIVNAERFNLEHFADDTAFADCAPHSRRHRRSHEGA